MHPINPTHPVVLAADVVSLIAIVGTGFQLFPPLAALAAMIWYMINIWESKTFVQWRRRRAQKKQSLKRLRSKGLVEIKEPPDVLSLE